MKHTVLSFLLFTALGCDFALQPENEIANYVIITYENVTGETIDTDVRECVRTYTISYVDGDENGHVECGNYANSTGCATTDLLTREIKVLKTYQANMDTALSHEFLHSLLHCLEKPDHGAAHKNPLYWTCVGSVEWELWEHYSEGYPTIGRNGNYTTICEPGTEPPEYNPAH